MGPAFIAAASSSMATDKQRGHPPHDNIIPCHPVKNPLDCLLHDSCPISIAATKAWEIFQSVGPLRRSCRLTCLLDDVLDAPVLSLKAWQARPCLQEQTNQSNQTLRSLGVCCMFLQLPPDAFFLGLLTLASHLPLPRFYLPKSTSHLAFCCERHHYSSVHTPQSP